MGLLDALRRVSMQRAGDDRAEFMAAAQAIADGKGKLDVDATADLLDRLGKSVEDLEAVGGLLAERNTIAQTANGLTRAQQARAKAREAWRKSVEAKKRALEELDADINTAESESVAAENRVRAAGAAAARLRELDARLDVERLGEDAVAQREEVRRTLKARSVDVAQAERRIAEVRERLATTERVIREGKKKNINPIVAQAVGHAAQQAEKQLPDLQRQLQAAEADAAAAREAQQAAEVELGATG